MNEIRLFAVLSIATVFAACETSLPENTPVGETRWLQQNWSAGERFWFHHATQGTSTLPVPYAWFVALERPQLSLFGDPQLLSDPDYLRRFGFIPSPDTLDVDDASLREYGYSPEDERSYTARRIAGYGERESACYDEAAPTRNPDRLPVGFVRTCNVKNPTTGEDLRDQIGLTCAACHTGHLEFNGVSLRIDGAPAVIDLGKVRETLELALAYTKHVPFRFGRFADRVLGPDHTAEQNAQLKRDFAKLLAKGKKLNQITAPVFEKSVEEGFTRLDALNRIGNQVFFEDLLAADRDHSEALSNLIAISAPVSFPYIWDTPWFAWVQYDASILQPMVRNAGEALGVAAMVNLTKPGPDLYRSLVQVDGLYEMEQLLAGENPWPSDGEEPSFRGLQAPKWPEDVLGEIDPAKSAMGEELYREICQGCHLPPVNGYAEPHQDVTFWDPMFWTEPNQAGERYLKFSKYRKGSKFANFVAIDYVGTDPAQARVIVERKVKVSEHLGVDPSAVECTETKGAIVTETSFAAALAVVVEKTVDKWYDDHDVDPATRERMNGYRVNCVQAEMYYKARPLNGVWATAPFLHNGSVPNLHELLSPAKERSETFYLGSRLFDPEKVGYRTEPLGGGFKLDTTEPGNSNKGHEFRHGSLGNGTIGRLLAPDEREALIEYLKTL